MAETLEFIDIRTDQRIMGIFPAGCQNLLRLYKIPVNIIGNLIKLSGYEPDVEIPIVYSGLRPGEKLYEEKLMAEEGMKKTDNDLIHIGKPIPFDISKFLGQLTDLAQASYENSPHIVEMVEEIVPTFHPVGNKPTGHENMSVEEFQREIHETEHR